MRVIIFVILIFIINCKSQQPVEHYWVFLCNSTNGLISYAHMPTIEVISNNILVAAWQESSGTEGSNDQHVSFSQSTNYGKTWSKQRTVVNGNGYAVWGPVLYYNINTKILYLFYSQSGEYNNRSTNRNYPGGNIMYQESNNNGLKWSIPIEILSYYSYGNNSKVTANPMITLNMNTFNRWILPIWQQPVGNASGEFSAVLISDNYGKTWNLFGEYILNNIWLIENSLALVYDNNINKTYNQTIYQLFRTKTGYIYDSYSYDSGITWTIPNAVQSLLNPNSKIQIFTSKATHYQILSYNPSKSSRYPLELAVSKDNTKTWNNYTIIGNETDISQAYPTSIEMNNQVYTVYSDDVHVGIRLSITASPAR